MSTKIFIGNLVQWNPITSIDAEEREACDFKTGIVTSETDAISNSDIIPRLVLRSIKVATFLTDLINNMFGDSLIF